MLQIESNKRPKTEPKQPKGIWLKLNPETTCSLHNLASNGHISLVSTLICKPFEALNS